MHTNRFPSFPRNDRTTARWGVDPYEGETKDPPEGLGAAQAVFLLHSGSVGYGRFPSHALSRRPVSLLFLTRSLVALQLQCAFHPPLVAPKKKKPPNPPPFPPSWTQSPLVREILARLDPSFPDALQGEVECPYRAGQLSHSSGHCLPPPSLPQAPEKSGQEPRPF